MPNRREKQAITGGRMLPKAKKRFGQNFLVDNGVVKEIVDSLELALNDHVIEIGPGEGAVTGRLLDRGARVTAIEIDRDLQSLLEQQFGSEERFTLIKGDVLTTDLADLVAGGTAKVVGNLPYNISTPILTRMIAARAKFERMVLMFQKEVVDRLIAKPGSSERGMMSVIAQAALDIDRVRDVTPSAFRPSPKVWSSIVLARPLAEGVVDEPEFRKLLSIAFAQKRKTLANNLKNFFATREIADAAEIDLSRRAETLTLEEWERLFRAAKKIGPA